MSHGGSHGLARADAAAPTESRGQAEGVARTSAGAQADAPITRSLIIPVYRNEENLPELFPVLVALNQRLGPGFEVIFVVDGSPDASAAILADAIKWLPFPTKVALHSRCFGSFIAVRTGLELASGKYITGMAADLQEPPTLVLAFFEALERDEADIVFAQRSSRADPLLTVLTSNFFWWVYRRMVQPDMPKGGIDVFACNASVREALLSITEPNSSMVAQAFWVGFRRKFVSYDRLPRMKGESAWTWGRRLRYMMDSIVSFSDAPIMALLWVGTAGCLASFVLGVGTVVGRLAGFVEVPGYASLLLAVLFFGSAILAAQGIIGCYVWRAFENTKHRPLRIITRVISGSGGRASAVPPDLTEPVDHV